MCAVGSLNSKTERKKSVFPPSRRQKDREVEKRNEGGRRERETRDERERERERERAMTTRVGDEGGGSGATTTTATTTTSASVGLRSLGLAPLSGRLSKLGAEVKQERLALLASLVRKLTPFDQGDENFDIALDFALYNVEHHAFLDTDPHAVEDLYRQLERRLELNSCLEKKKVLVETKTKVLEAQTVSLTRDANHRIVSLLYWLAGNPINAPTTAHANALTVSRPAGEETEGEDGTVGIEAEEEERNKWSMQEEIDLCESSSSLSDWESEDDTSQGLRLGSSAQVDETAAGESETEQVPQSRYAGEVAQSSPVSRNTGALEEIKPKLDESETYLVRKFMLMLRGLAAGGGKGRGTSVMEAEASVSQAASASQHESTFLKSTRHTVSDLSRRVDSLQSTLATCGDGDGTEAPTLSAFFASMRSKLDSYFSWLLNMEKIILAGNSVTLLEFTQELEMELHKVNYLEFVLEQVLGSFHRSDGAHVIASNVLTKLQFVWFNSDLDVAFNTFNSTSFAFDIFKATVQPYLRYLALYLTEGRVFDPHGEFFIQVAKDVNVGSNSFWSEGHRMRYDHGKECVAAPSFLLAVAERILLSGKALNLLNKEGIRERQGLLIPLLEGHSLKCSNSFADVENKENVPKSARKIAIEEFRANFRKPKETLKLPQMDSSKHNLLRALFREEVNFEFRKVSNHVEGETDSCFCPPQEHLDSCVTFPIKDYCQTVEEELLQSINLADHLSTFMKHLKSSSMLQSFDGGGMGEGEDNVYSINYKVTWPLSLLVTKEALSKYELFFRRLFEFKGLERQLAHSWQEQQLLRQQRLDATETSLRECLLGKEMLHFVNNYLTFMTFETLDSKWEVLQTKVRSARAIQEAIREHENFIDSVICSCHLLDSAPSALIDEIGCTCLSYGQLILGGPDRKFSDVAELGDKFHKLLKELIGSSIELLPSFLSTEKVAL